MRKKELEKQFSELTDEVKQLYGRLRKRIIKLENPPKYKYGDKVVYDGKKATIIEPVDFIEPWLEPWEGNDYWTYRIEIDGRVFVVMEDDFE